MWWTRMIMRDADKGGAGGAGGTGGTPPGEGGTPPSNGGTPPSNEGAPPNGGSPPAFDWATLKLDPAVQNTVDAHQWKDPSAAISSYMNLQKAMGMKGTHPERFLLLPKEDAPPEAWNEVFTRLGRPEKPEDYGLPVPDGQPKEFAGVASKWFHELGIPKGAAIKLAERWNAHILEQSTAAQAATQTAHTTEMTALKTEWAADYDANTILVDKAAEAFGMTQDQLQGLKQAMGPAKAMKFLHTIGSKLGVEGSFVDGQGNAGGGAMSQAQAKAEIQRLMSDRTFIDLWNGKGGDLRARQEARQRLAQLQQLAAPGTTTVGGRS